ncbi:MAG: MBL fold metallo-hydrolase, partial [Candidatus Eremiobacterota bacterium]
MSWQAALVNPPGGDPGLYLSLPNREGSILIDCGDLSPLSLRDLLRVRRLFVSHTHIDHFVGFDQLLRAQLFSPNGLEVYGPEGLTDQVRGKLSGYAWNLVDDSPFRVVVHEIRPDSVQRTAFWCRDRFQPLPDGEAGGIDLQEPVVTFCWVVHNVPCLAYRLEWRAHTRVDKQALKELAREPGPWLSQLKRDPAADPELAARVLQRVPARALVYVTDTLWNKESGPRLLELARGAEELWCEACFVHNHLDKAREHLHLTARQAGRLARDAGVARLHLFHHSRRYADGSAHLEEAAAVFPGVTPTPVLGS